MTLEAIKEFFMWCTVVNVSILIFSYIVLVSLKDFVYRTHSKWIPVSKEQFHMAMYSFFALHKILVIVFNVIPYIALSIMG